MRQPGNGVEDVLTPAALWDAYRDLATQRDDLRVQQWILGTPRLQHEWLNSIGVTQESELAALIAPLPPVALRTITAAPDAQTFLWSGFVDAREFVATFHEHHALGATRTWTSLDFGCGCGRLTRFFGAGASARDIPAWDARACDINPDHVEWCQQHLPHVDTRLNGPRPPLPFADRSIDFAYSLSVFSHMPPEQATAWLADLERVVRPGVSCW